MGMGMLKILLVISLGPIVQSALVWNTGGEAALFISIAIPIDLPTRHVFMSYNFEASYRLPRTWHKRPPIFRRGNGTHIGPHSDPLDDFEDYYDDYEDHEYHDHHEHHDNHEQHHKRKKPKPPKRKKPKPLHHKPPKRKHKHKPKPKPPSDDYKDFFEGYPDGKARRHQQDSLLPRSKFYEILSQRFQQHGFGSDDNCLLRLICEANSAQLGEINGVLGSLMHVMFSPSSSQDEALPQRYYDAERHGQRDNCAGYQAKCGRSVLDLITRPLIDYISNKAALH